MSERGDKHTDNGCVNRYWDGLVAMPTAGVGGGEGGEYTCIPVWQGEDVYDSQCG